jgi:hypothetical protein
MLVAAIVLGTFVGTAFAVAQQQQITATLDSGIKIVYSGVEQTMKDTNGNVVYPIIYNGTTYVPIRAVSNMLGVSVDWKDETRTVLLGTQTVPLADTPSVPVTSSGALYLGFDLEAYQNNRYATTSTTVKMGGMSYNYAIMFNPNRWPLSSLRDTSGIIDFNLDGNYSSISGKVGHVDGSRDMDAVLTIYGDEKIIKTCALKPNMFGDDISFNVAGIRQLKIDMSVTENVLSNEAPKYALAEMKMYK